MRKLIGCLFIIVVLNFDKCDGLIEHFDEKLILTPIARNELRVEFRFQSERQFQIKNESSDFLTFPRIIQELLSHYSIQKLTVTMAQGRWNLDEWGKPPQPSAAAGAQVFAEFSAESEEKADEKMKFLVEALNGVLCTSISHINVVTAPELSIFGAKNVGKTTNFRRFGVLSSETTCTENLTRLRKLLACKENGLSTLLHPSKLYNSLYHSSHIQVEQNCENSKCSSSIEVGVSVVFRNPSHKTQRHWSLADIFGRKLTSHCKIARSSQIEVHKRGGVFVTDLKNATLTATQPFEVYVPVEEVNSPESTLKIWSSQGGIEQKHGVLTVHLSNSQSSPSNLKVTQIIPYYVHIRYSGIEWRCDGRGVPSIRKILKNTRNAESPTLLQYEMEMEAGQNCQLVIPFDKQLLRLEQYPPDANHGMHIPAASVLVDSAHFPYTVHSNAILVLLPVPDFSMPFNVICFVATAFALVFGPIQLYSTLFLAPAVKKPQWTRKIHRAILLAIIAFCLYAHMMDINLNEVRRGIETYFEKLNELK